MQSYGEMCIWVRYLHAAMKKIIHNAYMQGRHDTLIDFPQANEQHHHLIPLESTIKKVQT